MRKELRILELSDSSRQGSTWLANMLLTDEEVNLFSERPGGSHTVE